MKTYLKKNKALFILPLILIPFIILIFYVLGGGEDAVERKESAAVKNAEGANYNIPEAEKSIEIFDKMEAYQQQTNLNEELKSSSWNVDSTNNAIQVTSDSAIAELSALASHNHQLPENLLTHIKQKEQQLRKELEEPEQRPKRKANPIKRKPSDTSKPKKTPMQTLTGIEELDKVFDKNMELNQQNDSLKYYLEQSKKRLAEIEQKQKISFSLDKNTVPGFNKISDCGSLIKAEIYETTTVLNGNRIKLRLLEDTWVNEKKVARGAFIYGISKIKNERLHIEITRLPVGAHFLPVNLAIHDLDGLRGLYVPDNVARKVTEEVSGGTNTSSLFGVTNDPLTYAGIRAVDKTAQTLLKRTRVKKVTVKKNTLVYIINQK